MLPTLLGCCQPFPAEEGIGRRFGNVRDHFGNMIRQCCHDVAIFPLKRSLEGHSGNYLAILGNIPAGAMPSLRGALKPVLAHVRPLNMQMFDCRTQFQTE
jgi:hypothetical protein